MLLTVPSPVALSVANLIRTVALSQYPSWRPFAYKFDNKASILTVDSVKEDPITINSAFGSLNYSGPEVELNSIITETYNLNGVFDSKQLATFSQFSIAGEAKLLTPLESMSLSVSYIYASGIRTEEQNRRLFPTDANTVIVSSRHTSLESIGFKITENPDGLSSIEFNCNNEQILANSVEKIKELLVIK